MEDLSNSIRFFNSQPKEGFLPMCFKRMVSFLLALACVIVLLPAVPAEAATYNGVEYNADPTTWKQTDPAWAGTPLGSSGYTMKNSGCLVTAIAIQMGRAKVYNTTQFNPGVLMQWFNSTGAFASNGGLQFSLMNCPRFRYVGEEKTDPASSLSEICWKAANLQKQGYLLIARVGSRTGRSNHFVALGGLSINDGSIYDPGYRDTRLNVYDGTIKGLLYFKTDPSAKDTIFNGSAIPWSEPPAASQPSPAPVTIQAAAPVITYNANGGSVSPATQTIQAGKPYSLPTPTRKNAAFLGWYASSGALVTNKTPMPAESHTLLAKWDTKGNSFARTRTYNNCFTDVSQSNWFYQSVASVYAYGLMNGDTATTFAPDAPLPLAQAITMAARINKQYISGNMTFQASNPWYLTYSQYAKSKGIISALPTNPDGTITRQEFAAILANALPDSALPHVNMVPSGSIPDVYRSDTGIYKLYRAGIFAGNGPNGEFLPNNPITRAEAAAVLVRVADPTQRVVFSLM